MNRSDWLLLQQLANRRKRKQLLAKPHAKLAALIRNICFNLLRGNIVLSSSDRKKLGRYSKLVRKLGNPQIKSVKDRDLKQSGGFLPIVIPALISLVADLLGKIVTAA